MAKRRKKARRVYRRRRIGAIRGGGIGDALTIIAGAALGGVAKRFIPGNETIKNGAVTALGVFFPQLVKGNMGAKLGAGMVAYGGVSLVKQFVDPSGNFIAGMQDSLSIPMRVGEIQDNLSVIAGNNSVMAGNGSDSLSVLAGYDEEADF
jgi:hypothetical protein